MSLISCNVALVTTPVTGISGSLSGLQTGQTVVVTLTSGSTSESVNVSTNGSFSFTHNFKVTDTYQISYAPDSQSDLNCSADTSTLSGVVGNYSPVQITCQSGVWTPMAAQAGLNDLSAFGATWTGTEMITSAGYNGNAGTTVRTAYAFNPTTNSWRTLPSGTAGDYRSYASLDYLSNTGLVYGAYGVWWEANWVGSGINLLVSLDPIAGVSWTHIHTSPAAVPPNAPSKRFGHTSAVTQNGRYLVIFGGWVWSGAWTYPWNGSCYDSNSGNWSAMNMAGPNAPTFLGGATEAMPAVYTGLGIGNKFVLWGGYTGGTAFNAGYTYDCATDTWTTFTGTNVPAARYAHGSVKIDDDSFAVFGGKDASGTLLNSGGIYHISTNTWDPFPSTNAPSARSFPVSMSYYNGNIIVWGGVDSGNAAITNGARYHIASGKWIPLSTTNAPTAGAADVSLSTSQGSIIFGNYKMTTGANSGSIYKVQ
jgi:hypothetical protein